MSRPGGPSPRRRAAPPLHLLLWRLEDGPVTVDDLRTALPPLPEPGRWLWDAAGERFGAFVHGEAPEAVDEARRLLGRDPDLFETFDVLEPRAP